MKMKKFLSAILMLCLLMTLFPAVVSAETVASGECGDGLTWVLTDDGVMTISGTGELGKTSGWQRYKEQIVTLIVEEGATGSLRGFAYSTSLTTVSLPSTLTDIGQDVFYGCSSLRNIVIPENVEYIRSNAFNGCVSLTEINIPASVKSFGARPFGGCTNLRGIWVDPNNPYYTSDSKGVVYTKDMSKLCEAPGALQGDYVIPSSVTSIMWAAFHGCRQMTSVNIPSGVTKFGGETFLDCVSLREITIPASIYEINLGEFRNCSGMKRITFLGDAPHMKQDDIFEGVTANAYYPGDNATWTADVMKDYGGTLTWIPIQNEQPTDPTEPEPDETEPDETEPDETEPDETVPDETEPDETVPDETEPTPPPTTEPASTQPPETEPAKDPDETEPQDTTGVTEKATEPTEPDETQTPEEPEETTEITTETGREVTDPPTITDPLSESTGETEKSSGGKILLWIGIFAVLAGGGTGVFLLVKKRGN